MPSLLDAALDLACRLAVVCGGFAALCAVMWLGSLIVGGTL